MSRNVNKLTDSMQKRFLAFEAEMKRRGIPFMITSVDRSITEQMALYVQGRLSLPDVNKFRNAAGLYPLPYSENKIVTWTLESFHVVNRANKASVDDQARAFDIAILKGPNKPTWDLKVNVNGNDIPDYTEAGEIWESLGGVWGGRWGNPDYPHFQEGKEIYQ